MPDNLANDTQIAEQTQVKQPVSFGKVEKVQIVIPKDIPDENTDNNIENTNGANAILDANKGVDTKEKAAPAPTPEFNEAAFLTMLKSQGVEVDSLSQLKEKLTTSTPSTEQTPEQKEVQAKAAEKRRLDLFLSGNGTAEQYVAIKNIAEMDLAELSMSTLKKELKDAKFTEEQIDKIIKDRYYQIDEAELEQEEDETDKAFKKRSKEYFADKLANRSSYIQKQAQDALVQLNKVIESEDSQLQNELVTAANIDAQFKDMQREDTYEIGSINGKAIEPIKSQVSDEELAQVRDLLKDSAKRNNFLLTTDGQINITNIANVLAENAKLKAAIKVSYHEGSTRTNAFWETTFGKKSAQELGVGGITQKPNQTNGKPAGFGKTQRVQPQR